MLTVATSQSPQRLLGETFRNTILAWSQSGELIPVLADPLRPSPDGIEVTLLDKVVSPVAKTRFSLGDTEWPELGIHSSPYSILLFIIEGEADIRIGTVPQTTKIKNSTLKQGVCFYSLSRRNCLIIPPGVPYSDGSTSHWERSQPENGHSQILWLQILPTGAIMHTCRTAGNSHAHGVTIYIKDAQLSVLVQLMLESTVSNKSNDALRSSFLSTLLLCVDRNWASVRDIDTPEMPHVAGDSEHSGATNIVSNDSQKVILERACHYIHSHLTDPMSMDEIARHSYVSAAQLKRIFRAQLDTSIMKYVAQARIEEAKVLLQRTDLTIEDISENCGYKYRTHFSLAFKEQIGVSPQAYRSQIKTRNRDEISR